MFEILVLEVEINAAINKSLSNVDYHCEVVRAAEKLVIEIVTAVLRVAVYYAAYMYIAAIIANF